MSELIVLIGQYDLYFMVRWCPTDLPILKESSHKACSIVFWQLLCFFLYRSKTDDKKKMLFIDKSTEWPRGLFTPVLDWVVGGGEG